MTSWRWRVLLISALLTVSSVSASQAFAASSPAWELESLAAPTNFRPGEESGQDSYLVYITNAGGAETDGSDIRIVDELPAGVTVRRVVLDMPRGTSPEIGEDACLSTTSAGHAEVSCEVTNAVEPANEPARLNSSEGFFLRLSLAIPSDLSGPLVNHVSVEGGGAATMETSSSTQVTLADAEAGVQYFNLAATNATGLPVSGSNATPFQYTTAFAVNTSSGGTQEIAPVIAAGGDLKEIKVSLPPGFAANPTVTPRCTAQQFNSVVFAGENVSVNQCPDSSAIGLVTVQQLEGSGSQTNVPLYNLVPPKGMPAELGFQVLGAPIYVDTRVRSEGDFGVEAFLENVTEAERVTASRVIVWGVPGDPRHNTVRGFCGALSSGSCPFEGPVRPLLRLPSSCQSSLLGSFDFSTWARPAASGTSSSISAAPTDCSLPPFTPTIKARTTTTVADSPTGLEFNLHIPQEEGEEGPAPEQELGQADLRDTTVTLPAGLSVNPSSANGLAACAPSQVGLLTPVGQNAPIHFSNSVTTCPEASKIGVVEAKAPALDHTIKGAVYLATQESNPFKSLLAIYIVLEDPQSGIVVKLAAKVTPDPVTGQLTTTLTEAPQLPVEDFSFEFFKGPRAPLRTPPTCGSYVTNTVLTPWTAPEGLAATPTDQFSVESGPAGPCPSGALAPQLSAGLQNPAAGTYSPFVLRLTRADATGDFVSLATTTPKGLSARLAGVSYCPEAGIAQASSRSGPGGGAQELASPSCPPASRVGEIVAGAGAGPSPYFTGGTVYLAGPYRGAPLSLVAIVPAVAGPFDLGVVTDRIALDIDQRTAQVTAISDPFPTILDGIPLDVRDLRVSLNRPEFTLAPTNCSPASVTALVTGRGGATAAASDYFQMGGCSGLAFAPKLSLSLKGKTKRTGHPALKAVLTFPKAGDANIAKAQVALPHAEFLDQGSIGAVCTQAQLKSATCPAASIYGRARAWTPLLEKPLEGPVYLGVGFGHKLPDLVADLSGQIRILLNGKVDSDAEGGIRNTFEMVPDAPVSKFVLELKGGPKQGLLVNSENICRKKQKAKAVFTGQNGKVRSFSPVISTNCGSGAKKDSRADKGRNGPKKK